jgi:hypothetical protein
MTTKMLAPPGASGQYLLVDGTAIVPGADGTVDATPAQLGQLVALGFASVDDTEVDATSGRPTTSLVTGQSVFDTSLNKPIWRNAANTGWVDATGTAA